MIAPTELPLALSRLTEASHTLKRYAHYPGPRLARSSENEDAPEVEINIMRPAIEVCISKARHAALIPKT
ncbi:hypothetical protein CERSUDRAFT_99946 [Gelatoporia subvermispora B]|uniref:Uncharacterized protein n=1 Tax=Ceriporiopsis subvermispora (strain B) TaxID=914234 RepID=M2QZJ2_CERS8|nr:hypothetical protein CERSUDRAFT_99946 [Gelatoporia subvermispora B]